MVVIRSRWKMWDVNLPTATITSDFFFLLFPVNSLTFYLFNAIQKQAAAFLQALHCKCFIANDSIANSEQSSDS